MTLSHLKDIALIFEDNELLPNESYFITINLDNRRYLYLEKEVYYFINETMNGFENAPEIEITIINTTFLIRNKAEFD